MSAPSLDVLRIQAEHIRQQADALRQHLATHAEINSDFTGAKAKRHIEAKRHIDKATACCDAIDVLAERVHACITCAIDAQQPLPACANDRPPTIALCQACGGRGVDPMSDTGNNSLTCQECHGTGNVLRDRLAASVIPSDAESLAEQNTQLRREKAESDAREARVDADRDGVPPYGRAS